MIGSHEVLFIFNINLSVFVFVIPTT